MCYHFTKFVGKHNAHVSRSLPLVAKYVIYSDSKTLTITKSIIRKCFLNFRARLHETKVNSNRFEISNRFEMLFRLHGNLHGDFTA